VRYPDIAQTPAGDAVTATGRRDTAKLPVTAVAGA
jgi:hypothetical protein